MLGQEVHVMLASMPPAYKATWRKRRCFPLTSLRRPKRTVCSWFDVGAHGESYHAEHVYA